MISIIFESIFISFLHAVIPNHWLPLVAVGQAQSWSRSKILQVTLAVSFLHVTSTIVIGIILGSLGKEISTEYEALSHFFVPVLLFSLGAVYIYRELRSKFLGDSTHSHTKHETRAELSEELSNEISKPLSTIPPKKNRQLSSLAAVASLSGMMFFSPCLEMTAYFFRAGMYGWQGIIAVAFVFLLITVSVNVLLVYIFSHGRKLMTNTFLDRHEHILIGLTLWVVAVLSSFHN